MIENSNGKIVYDKNQLSIDENNQITLREYLGIMYGGRWIILTTFILVICATLIYTYRMQPVYESSTTLMIDEKQGLSQSLFDVPTFSQQRTQINNQVEILQSRALAKAVYQLISIAPERDSLNILRDEEGQLKPEALVIGSIQAALSVSPVRDTDLIKIDVSASSPFEATFLANSIAEAYQNLDRTFSQGEISQVVKFLDVQLERKENDLKKSEGVLKQFLETQKIASLDDEATQVVEQSAEFESLYKGALIEKEATQKRLDYLNNQLGKRKENLQSEMSRISTPLITQLRVELAEIERNIAVYLSQGVSENDPQVSFERKKAEAIKDRLSEEIRKLILHGLAADNPLHQAQDLVIKILEAEVEYSSVAARADALKKVVDEFSNKLESLPEKNVQLARLERNRKVDENLYMMMREKYEESLITQAGQIGKVRIIDTAFQPLAPVSPKPKLNIILGVLLGLGLGFGIAFTKHYLDNSIKRFEDIERLGYSVIGAIPNIEGIADLHDKHNRLKNDDATQNARLITHISPKSPISEAYRTLRTTLLFSQNGHPLKTMVVTSPGPGEGKTTTSANLAITLGQQGNRTIIIDTDLRRSTMHKLFNLNKKIGVTNVLIGQCELDEAIQNTHIQNLDILTSGLLPPNPAEMLGSTKMKNMIEQLKSKYDICIFDSPPLIAVTDAAVLASELDGVLLVVKAGQTHTDAFRRSIELLTKVKAKILGVLMNNINRSNTYGSYYHYYYYNYYYYYGEDRKSRRKRRNKSKLTEPFKIE